MPRYVLMSFKPLFAYKIIGKSMDCEVRSYLGSIEAGDMVLVYASTPVKALLGYFTVGRVIVDRYPAIVEALRRECRLFDEDNWVFIRRHYASTNRNLLLLKIRNPIALDKPIDLPTLRRLLGVKKPPRSYYVLKQDIQALARIIRKH